MATSLPNTKNSYRVTAAKLKHAALAARALLDLYSWDSTEGEIVFTTEPNPANIGNPAYFDMEVKSKWQGLRAALILAGLVSGEERASLMLDGAQFLRVEARSGPVQSGDGLRAWRTEAIFEVLNGVNSYGYADGRALGVFYEKQKAVAVRVVRDSLPLDGRIDYLEGDRHAVTDTTVIGMVNPFESPNALLTGWAVIGDQSQNPETDFYGFEDEAIIVIPGADGEAGEIGPRGLQGDTGPRGLPGVGVSGVGGGWRWFQKGVVEKANFQELGVISRMPVVAMGSAVVRQDLPCGAGLWLDGGGWLEWLKDGAFDVRGGDWTVDIFFSVVRRVGQAGEVQVGIRCTNGAQIGAQGLGFLIFEREGQGVEFGGALVTENGIGGGSLLAGDDEFVYHVAMQKKEDSFDFFLTAAGGLQVKSAMTMGAGYGTAVDGVLVGTDDFFIAAQIGLKAEGFVVKGVRVNRGAALYERGGDGYAVPALPWADDVVSGPAGADGAEGPQGLQGEQGPKGETGPRGRDAAGYVFVLDERFANASNAVTVGGGGVQSSLVELGSLYFSVLLTAGQSVDLTAYPVVSGSLYLRAVVWDGYGLQVEQNEKIFEYYWSPGQDLSLSISVEVTGIYFLELFDAYGNAGDISLEVVETVLG